MAELDMGLAADLSAMSQQIMEEFEEIMLTADDGDLLQQLADEMSKMLDLTNTLGSPVPLVDELSPMEHVAMQQEEVEALTAIYGEDITMLNNTGTCFCIKMKFMSDVINDDDVIRIWFSLPPNYPSVPPVIEIETNASGTFTYSDADILYDRLMHEASQRIGATMVFDLVGTTLELLPDMLQQRKERIARQEAADKERKTQLELTEAINSKRKGFIPASLWSELVAGTEFSSSAAHSSRSSGDSSDDEELTSAGAHDSVLYREYNHYRPQQFVGPVTQILKHIPETLQITRMENILRQDLANRFHQCLQTAYKELSEKERRFPMMFNLKPQLMFHGTRTKSLPSIVQHGLVIPGANNQVKVQNGSSFGKGIYLSPNADFSLGYTDSSRLIVCAALPGRVYKDNFNKGHHSRIHVVVSSCENEWVFFNAAQVLPCYVIQVTTRQARHPVRVPPPLSGLALEKDEDTSDMIASVALKEKREKLLARARKFLPYGFGPGSKTVIEEAGDIDDDEEDYGDYQMLRYMEDGDSKSLVSNNSSVKTEYTALQHYRHVDNDGQVPTS